MRVKRGGGSKAIIPGFMLSGEMFTSPCSTPALTLRYNTLVQNKTKIITTDFVSATKCDSSSRKKSFNGKAEFLSGLK